MCVIAALKTAQIAGQSILGGIRANRQAKAEAQIEEHRALLHRQNARLIEDGAAAQIVQRQRAIHQRTGLRSALFGASNIEQQSGSARDVLIGDIEQGALDIELIRADADQRARASRFQAGLNDYAARRTRFAGRRAQAESLLAAREEIFGF